MLIDLYYELLKLWLVSSSHPIADSIVLNLSIVLSVLTIGLVLGSVLKFIRSIFK